MSFLASRRSQTTRLVSLLLTTVFLLTATPSVFSVSADPEMIETLKSSGQFQRIVDRLAAARARGVWQPDPAIADRGVAGQALSFDPNVPDTFRVLVILVDFSDNPASGGLVYGQPSDFTHLLFSYEDNDGHYSMAEFYRDNSYGNFVMEGQVVGWVRAPQTYEYYVDGQNGFGSYPQNAQRLSEDAILLADPVVDYSQFDADGNGWMDGVFIVHAGPGAEQTGDDNHIWSHKWSLSSTLTLDGINVRSYTAEPEENTSVGLTTMGVYAHEYGHFIGLPDLYDTDYSSSGVGDWSLMAGGSWNGGGRFPAFMDAWCKKQVGFLEPTNVTANQTGVELPSVYHNPVAYRLWANGSVGSQYFLIENRRRGEFDTGIPGDGLLIYHIDESVGGNWNEEHPLVAVEQADGLFQLENDVNQGDGADLWSTLTKTDFDDLSTPNTRTYTGGTTQTAVWGISAPDSVMYANFDITFSRPRFELLSGTFSDAEFGNGNGIAEQGEMLTFSFNVKNLWLSAPNTTGTLVADNNDIIFNTPTVNIGTVSGFGGTGDNTGDPITFTVPEDFAPCIDSFFLTVDSDVPNGARTFGFELHVGSPDVLLVDDDNGATYNQVLEQRLFNRRQPFDLWDKSVSGSPSAATLQQYRTVIWIIGDERADIISAADINALQAFLDGGGNLFMTGQSIVRELDGDDQAFLHNYLRAVYNRDQLYPFMYGVDGAEIGDGIQFRFASTAPNQTDPQVMDPTNGSVSEFTIPVGGTTVLSYDGTYKLVLMSFGFEAIGDEFVSQGWVNRDTLFSRIMEFFRPDTASLNPAVPSATVVGEPSVLNLTNHVPQFAWSVDDTSGAGVQQYQIQVGTGNLCYNWDNMWSPAVFSGSDTSVTYGGEPLEDGQSYVFRVRVFNGVNWSAWKSMNFRMNSLSGPGLLVQPVEDTVVTTPLPPLRITRITDPDGDIPTHDFEVYSDPGLTSLVASAAGIPRNSPFTEWTVDVPLTEDGEFWWRSRAFDGYEYTGYTSTGHFLVNAENLAPLAFDLVEPFDGTNVLDTFPRLTWRHSEDPDIGDSVAYTLWTSTDPNFVTYVESPDLADSFRTLTYPVTFNATYYWKVMAIDRWNDTTWSSQTFTFTTIPPTCCTLRGDVDDNETLNVSDLTYLVNFLFKSGPEPPCDVEGNVDADGAINVADLTYLVNYLFKGGPEPPACS